MLGCQQWSGEPEAERGSRRRKSEVLGDLEGLLGNVGERAKVRRCTAVEDLVYQDGNLVPDACRNTLPVKADECVETYSERRKLKISRAAALTTDCIRRIR